MSEASAVMEAKVTDHTEDEGGATTLSLNSPHDPAPTYPEIATLIPKEYASKPWVKDLKDVPTIFKMLEDQKAALSRRPGGVPQDNAKPEEWAAFNKALGVPEKPEEYEFGKMPEGMESNKEFEADMRKLFHGAGVTKRQVPAL